MEVKIKSEKEVNADLPRSPSPSALCSTVTQTNGTDMTRTKDSPPTRLEPKPQAKDVFTDGTSQPGDMPAIDLRIVKKEKFDEDELEAEASKRRSPTRGSNGLSQRGLNLLDQESRAQRMKTTKTFVSLPREQDDGRTSKENVEEKSNMDRSRFSEGIESYPYRVPIVYPIHSPPIDYRSINSGRSPSPNSYRLEEGERSASPMMNQRQLYEETHWPSMGGRHEAKFGENNSSGFTGCKTAHASPPMKNSPFNSGSQDQDGVKERSSSPKDATHSNNVNSNPEKASFLRRRGKNSERIPSAEDDKEEESLWKQVQRYRHRKRPALGKLHPTQEETIFMQYNEIRERRHREGRIITRTGRPVMSHCGAIRDPSLTPPPLDSTVDQTDSKLPVLTSVTEKPIPPTSSEMDSYGSQGSRARVLEFPNSKGLVNSSIPASAQDTSSVQHSTSFNSNSMESRPGSTFDGNTEGRKTTSEQLESRSTPTHAQGEYQGYSSPSTHSCTGQQSHHFHEVHGIEARGMDARGMDARGIDARVVTHAAMDCRTNLSYEDCCPSLSSPYRHRPIHPLQRFHLGENNCYDNSCHDNRRRRMSPCGHHCYHHKRPRRTSSDDADEYNDDNDENNHWQCSPKEKRSRSEHDSSRDMNNLFRHDDQPHPSQNGSQPFSPSSSADSRDNESIDNGQNQDFQQESEGQFYENGHISQEGSPRVHGESERRFQTSPFPGGEREPDDDDVICHVNGLFSLPGYRETKYDITRGELKRRTEPPETLTRVEMISYVRQAKTSGRILLDTNGITTSNRSHPTILSRVCEREAQVLACGIHKMNLEYLPLKKLVQVCVNMYKSRGCDGCQDCRLKLRRRIVDVEITRNMLKEFLHVFQEANAEGFLDSFELASHTFGTMNIVNHIKIIDEYHKLLLLALEKE